MNLNNIQISKDKAKLNIDSIKKLLKQTYWANEREENTILKSIENSICYGVYLSDEQIGFGRVVTDYSTFYWICDIIIDEAHRGKGLGKHLVDVITNSEELKGLLGVLLTRDAHGLYEQYGFIKEPIKCLTKKRTNN